MAIKLSDHFTYKKMFRFTLAPIVMMIFTSIYSMVDGFFVSNFVGKDEFAAVNFIYPYIMMLSAFGFMFGAGGSAIVGKELGEQRNEDARKHFTFLVIAAMVFGLAVGVLAYFTVGDFAKLMGAEGLLLDNSIIYGRILAIGLPFFTMQMMFQNYFVTAEKPTLGFISTVIAGCSNIILDFVLVGWLKLGLVSAAIATISSQIIGALIPIIYFTSKNNSLLRFVRFDRFYARELGKTFSNGISELLSNISMSLVNAIYNYQLMKYIGEDGVSAYGVLMYVCLIFLSIFIGYAIGMGPVISYNLGAKNTKELSSIFKKTLVVLVVSSISMLVVSELLAYPVSYIYVGYDETLLKITTQAFLLYSICFLFSGFPLFLSSAFTALNDGITSAIISFVRLLILQIGMVFLLPLFWGVNGIWLSVPIAEALAAVLALIFLFTKQKKFGYRLFKASNK